MTATVESRTVRRLTVDVGVPFDAFRARYERAVPAFDLTGIERFSTWDEVVADAEKAAPNGFLRYGTIDTSPGFSIAGHKARSVIYLMGNHTIAETMYGINPAVMLYAPLRLALYEDAGGHAHLTLDQPSDQFGSFGDSDIAATGELLDRKVADLLRGLGAAVPDGLD
jgi:hypothetical protein